MSKGTLLLADDSITIQKVVNLTFADEGIDVIAVGDGDTAAARLVEIMPDIVLADVNMPGLTGYQICEMIRANERTKDIPVVLLVGSFEPFDEAEAQRVGASSYMTKPFQSIRQLVAQVTDLMENKGAASEVSIPLADEAPAESAAADTAIASPETGDIESLYQSSFGTDNSPDQEQLPELPREHIDAGMDDEMILTTYAGEAAAEGGWAFQGEQEDSVVTSTDFSAAPIEQPEEPQSSTEEPAGAPVDPFADTAPFESSNVETQSEHDRSVEAAAAASDAENIFEFSAPEAEVSQQPVESSAPSLAAPPSDDFDEVDLLEIPGIERGKPVEFTTAQAAAASETPTQVVSLSPELMEIIVQRVVEKLSEKY